MPEDAHRELNARAAMAGMSLSEHALSELLRSLERPTMEELMERTRSRPPVDLGDTVVRTIREMRDSG